MVYHYSMVRVAHSGMTADEMVENVMTAVSTISAKLALVSKSFVYISFLSFCSIICIQYFLCLFLFFVFFNRAMFVSVPQVLTYNLYYISLSDRKKHKNHPFEESDLSCAAHLHL